MHFKAYFGLNFCINSRFLNDCQKTLMRPQGLCPGARVTSCPPTPCYATTHFAQGLYFVVRGETFWTILDCKSMSRIIRLEPIAIRS